MRKIYLIVLLSLGSKLLAQNPEIKNDLPTIIPPSPTVSALMKFEEVPVSNYTGVPDVSIPLFSSATHSKSINLDVSMKYHPGSIAADERAGDVGLGWSLFAGGTISRTVRGLPDEILTYPSGGQGPAADPVGKIGLYHTDLPNDSNNYYYFNENIVNETKDFYLPNLSQQTQDIGNEFLWNTNIKGKYDTEHDLWQFNFMGKSGRFYIKKNATNQLEIVPLEDYRIKIINYYSTQNGNNYIPTSFTIFDELGNRYLFDVVETSLNYGISKQTFYSYESGYSDSESMYSEKLFNSSFHLSKVYDNNNKLIIDFQYDPITRVEGFSNHSWTNNEYLNLTGYQLWFDAYNVCQDFPAVEVNSVSSTNINVKKLVAINIVDIATINFEFLQGRDDNNINNGASTSYLNSIIISNLRNNQIDSQIKKYTFEYDYSMLTNTFNTEPVIISKRLILKKINVFGNQTLAESNYEFFYEENPTYGKIIGKDSWGYLNLINPCYTTTEKHRNASPEFSTTDILQKIKYPTGGCAIFNYEANQYSFIGDQEVTNFDENPDSYTKYNEDLLGFDYDTTVHEIEVSTSKRMFKFRPDIHEEQVTNNNNNNNRKFSLKKKVNGTWTTAINSLICPFVNQDCCFDFIAEANTEYKIVYEDFDTFYTGTDYLTIEYYNVTPKFYLYGGGNRIKQIGYFKNDAPQDYYKILDNSLLESPDKEKNFNYNLFSDNQKSSGSLVFPKPLFNYLTFFSTELSYGAFSVNCLTPFNHINHSFQTRTSYNNLSIVKTQGSDVGYKEVTVYETNNGRIEYTYTSPLEHPEENVPTGPPFIPTKNFDYKRGLPLKETVYDNQNRKLSESESSYDFIEEVRYTGTRFRKPFGECYTGSANNFMGNYGYYLNSIDGDPDECIACQPNASTRRAWLCGLPLDVFKPKILVFPIFEAYGWAQLKSKTSRSYFYDSTTIPKVMETYETYTYNPINKQISESTVTNSNQSEVLKTNYFYHTGNSSYSQNRIAEIEKIETYRGSELLSTSQINYVNNWSGNASYLPQSIVTSKGNATLENRLNYELYDDYGNPLQLKQEGGTVVTYIWGYNKTQPIAKIENATYAQVSSFVSNLQTLSNGTDETSFIGALNDLRTALPNAMITTLTYIPLVGVHTITDPKGDTQTYEYDTFGRLKAVYDKDDNKLSQNDYHYKPQN